MNDATPFIVISMYEIIIPEDILCEENRGKSLH